LWTQKNEIMKKNLEFEGEKLRKCYPTKEWMLGKSSKWFWAAYLLRSGNNLQKNSKQKLAGNAAKHTKLVKKKNCFYTEIFYIQKSENESLYFDLSKRVLATENGMK
jgi:hypothetical protein